jgi:hypothetical protein
MTKWIVIIAIVVMAPAFVTNLFASGVNFVSTQGKALTTEVVREATKTFNEVK